ncbi:prolipoprotein diacylglyceryl transferase [Aureimonas endophytica]|uniref:Phosphatidylglycerol--prolipoprotein diacylglyceryl transferase n=1 Tax=Aureimonas endophytica TaxID=2027858 RepID=A0A916ZZP8_9HYPH|nr:prolipoprotein diacylglyceryl transferase [Aureimonas endophytica]GGE19129.1 prolipoprotein diacylglyceryl transferase [Aureimonas endophytica]
MISIPAAGLLTYPDIDPIILRIGPVALHWYGVAYVAGILCGWLYGRHLVANKRLWPNGVSPITPEQIDDFILWITGGIILGGRLGSVLFYDFDRYLANPLDIFAVWEGGMSFHGGLLGVVIAIVVFTWKNRIPIFSLMDVVAASTPFGLFFGRLANFVNGELWGAPTTVPWAMVFPKAGDLPRHPSQLYEAALEGIVLWLILRLLTHHFRMFRRPRFVGSVFIGLYGLMRIFVEFFRMPDAQLGYLLGTSWLTMGMVLSTPMLAVAAWGLLTAKPRTYEPRPADLATPAKP